MLRCNARAVTVGWFVAISLASSAAAQTAAGAYEETISRVLVLLPRQPEKVLVVDVSQAARPHDAHGRRVEAFVRRGENVVYLIAQGGTLQRGQRGASVFDYVLATVIWHEMAHIDGADEPGAQRQEEELWMQYVAARRVDTAQGMNYLALLRKRR
jgi:hypothetical protein